MQSHEYQSLGDLLRAAAPICVSDEKSNAPIICDRCEEVSSNWEQFTGMASEGGYKFQFLCSSCAHDFRWEKLCS
jgi:hypothetical protein